MRGPIRIAIAFAALGLVAAACSDTPTVAPTLDVAGPSPTVAATPGTSSTDRTAPEILRFEGQLLNGGTLDGTSLAGKDVAFWFWAPW
jgi:hypothetical protein